MKTTTVSPSRRALTMRLRRSLRRTSTTAGCAIGPPYSTHDRVELVHRHSAACGQPRRTVGPPVASSGHATPDPLRHRPARPPPHRAGFGAAARGMGLDPVRPRAASSKGSTAAVRAAGPAGGGPHRQLVVEAAARGVRGHPSRSSAASEQGRSSMRPGGTRGQSAYRRGRGLPGRGPLAVGVVTGLLHSGVGTVHTATSGAVHGRLLGTGFADADRGSGRLAATQAAVVACCPRPSRGRRRCSRSPISPCSPTRSPIRRWSPRCAPTVSPHPGGPATGRHRRRGAARAARAHRLPGLPRPRAGPGLIRDGPAIAARLVGRPGAADPACATATVGLAAAQVVAVVEGGRPAEPGGHAGARRPRRARPAPPLESHSECPCGAARHPGEAGPGTVDRASPAGRKRSSR